VGLFDWKQLERRRMVAIARPRVKALLTPHRSSSYIRDDSEGLGIAPPFLVKWPEEVVRPRVGLVQDTDSYPYWTKYRRFLETNQFPFRLVDIHARSWLDALSDVDILIWRPTSEPSRLEEARRKIFYLNEFLGMKTYPSLRAVTLYEDKILQSWTFGALGVDTPPTVSSFSLPDALEGVKELGDEVVWKITTGSGSFGVELMNARRARAAIRRTFSVRGRRTYWPYLNQKDYVYAQALQRDLRTDMRVIVVGPLLFGWYREAPPGDFRASGMGRERMEEIPPEALEEAWRISRVLGIGAVAVDYVVDRHHGQRQAIELCSFTGVHTLDQLRVDGRIGAYVRCSEGRFEFHEGRYWLQELALAEALARLHGIDADRLLLDSVLAG
jgi:glutathione synthase/RimK-type ligase-like ATP-grasp enzyme